MESIIIYDNILNNEEQQKYDEELKNANNFCFSTSIEFLLNKNVYKKIINNGNCLQTIRENDERKQYMIKYKIEIKELFIKLLNDNVSNNVIIISL